MKSLIQACALVIACALVASTLPGCAASHPTPHGRKDTCRKPECYK